MSNFVVTDPFEVPIQELPRGVVIDEKELKKFWGGIKDRNSPGCYVFAIRSSGRGFMPVYVGKSEEQSLERESFNGRNLKSLNLELASRKKGKLYIFLVVQVKGKGKWNKKEIGEIEELLIACAAEKNNELINSRLIPKPTYRIKGLVNAKPGESSNTTREFRQMIGLNHN